MKGFLLHLTYKLLYWSHHLLKRFWGNCCTNILRFKFGKDFCRHMVYMTSVINLILSDYFLGFFLLKLWRGFLPKLFLQDSNCMFEPSLIVDHIIFILGWLPISSGVELHCGIIGTTLSSLSPDFWKAPQSWRWILFSMAVDNFFWSNSLVLLAGTHRGNTGAST